MDRRTLLAVTGAILAAGCASGPVPKDLGTQRRQIDRSVDLALAQLYARPGMRDRVNRAQAVLVFPQDANGQGAMRRQNQTTGYYSLGAAAESLYLLFVTADALQAFDASKGWPLATDAGVIAMGLTANTKLQGATVNKLPL